MSHLSLQVIDNFSFFLFICFLFLESISGNNTELIQISGRIRNDAYSVRFYITFLGSKKSNLTLEENYCICDNVTFSISKI